MANKRVYMFEEGDMTMRNLLGGKGANLAEMTKIGLPVPQGFTVTTEACTQYYEDGRKINDEIMAQVMEGVKKMEEINGKKFGDRMNIRSSLALTSRQTLLISSSLLSRLYSVHGTTLVQTYIVVITISLIHGVLQLT